MLRDGMSSRRRLTRLSSYCVGCVLLAAAGCYDVDGDPAGPPGSGPRDSATGADSGGTPDGAVGMDSGARDSSSGTLDTGATDTGATDTGATDSGASDSGPTDTGAGGSCPDIYGAFSMMSAGVGCGDFNAGAAQRIDGDRVACVATFASADGVNGTANVLPTGSLSGASLSLGTASPTTCTGTWLAATSVMTVVCGAGASRCSVTLTRVGP